MNIKTALRLLLGLIFFVFGLNGFFNFLPAPQLSPEAQTFMGGLFSSGYFFPVLKGTEVIAGLALLSGYFVPLALVVLAPITLQIFLFHAFLAPHAMYLQALMILIHLSLGYLYRDSYREILRVK